MVIALAIITLLAVAMTILTDARVNVLEKREQRYRERVVAELERQFQRDG